MKGICGILAVLLIYAGLVGGGSQDASSLNTDSPPAVKRLYVGDFQVSGIPTDAEGFCRPQMLASEALSLQLEGVTLGQLLSNGEYDEIYLSLRGEPLTRKDFYWQVLILVRQTQPQATVFLEAKQGETDLQVFSDGRNVFLIPSKIDFTV